MSTKYYKYAPATVHWDAIADTPYGSLEELTIQMPATFTGRMDIWSVPACDAYPEGYFVGLASGPNAAWTAEEPGCEDWKKHKLASIEFNGVSGEIWPDDDGQSSNGNNRSAAVSFQNTVIPAVQLEVPERVRVDENGNVIEDDEEETK